MDERYSPTPSDLIIDPIPTPSSPDTPKTREQLTQKRMLRLEEIAANPNFSVEQLGSALRVHEFLEKEDVKLKKNWSKYLITIDDWKLYHQLNPDWQG